MGEDELPGKDNYFIGNNPSKWHRNVPTYAKAVFQNVYPGVDLEYFGTQQGLEYDYVVAPGANASAIHMSFAGASSITSGSNGSVVLKTSLGDTVTEETPDVYQGQGSERHTVSSSFHLNGADATVSLGSYDHNQPLVIDPTIVYSSYLGDNSDVLTNVTTDSAGDIYTAGFAHASGYPTVSAYQGSFTGADNVVVTKLDPQGTGYVYSTYLGGSGIDVGRGIAVDSTGNLYIDGYTTSSNFPTASAYDGSYSGSSYDGFVTKLNSAGSALDYSTYLGGNNETDLWSIAINHSGEAYVAGGTSATNFPTAAPIQGSLSGSYDLVLSKFSSSGGSLVYSTYLGSSSGNQYPENVVVDASGDAYVAGTTTTSGLATGGSAQSSYGSGADDDIAYKVNAAGSMIDWATYIGGSGDNEVEGLAIDGTDNIYVGGATTSTDFPHPNAIQGSNAGGWDNTITEIAASGSSFIYSTYLGGSGTDYIEALAADSNGDVFFGGATASTDLHTANASQASEGGGYDGTYGEIGSTNGTYTPLLLVFSYIGGSSDDLVYGVALDWSDNLYLAGRTSSSDFPTANPLDGSYGSSNNGFVAEISIGPNRGAETEAEAPKTCSCAGDPVNTESGNFYETDTDISIPGRSYPLAIERTYNSQNASVDGPFGYGWTYNYGMSLVITGTSPNQVATISEADAAQVPFDQPATGSTWTPASASVSTLTYNSGSSTWTFVDDARDTYTFNSSGQLTQEEDLNGYITSFSYTSGDLTTITDPAGRTLTLTWTGSNITGVTDANVAGNTRTVAYGYTSGNLTSVTDVNGGITDFAYDGSHHMTLMRAPDFHGNGSLGSGPSTCSSTPTSDAVNNHYDGSGRVDCQWDAKGNKTTFSYSGSPQTATGGTTLVTDPVGNEVESGFAWGLNTFETAGYGTAEAATTYFTYDQATLAPTGEVDPDGNVITQTVDGSGNVLTSTDPLGNTTTSTYNSFNEPLTLTDPNGVTTTNAYDGSGNLTSTSTPVSGSSCPCQVTTYNYSDESHPGDLTSVENPDGKTSYYGYDSDGNQVETKDPEGNVSASVYNADGWLTASYSPKAGCTWGSTPPTGCSASYKTAYSYVNPLTTDVDEFGQVQTVTDPDSNVTTYTYDADGHETSVTDGNGNTATTAYDADGEACWTYTGTSSNTCSSAPSGASVTDYNDDGTVADQKDGAGHAILTYSYNADDQVTSTADALSNETDYTYNGDGDVLTKQEPGGSCAGTLSDCTTYTYNADDQPVSVSYSDGTTPDVSSIIYDADGHETGMTDGTGTSSWSYDQLGRLTSYENGNGKTVSYSYNLEDEPLTIVYPGSHTVTNGYDNDGRLDSVEDWDSNTSTFDYDPDSNVITDNLANGVTDTYTYDADDQVATIDDVNSSSVTIFSASYTRDDNEQLASDSSQASNQGSYAYTAKNQLCYAGSTTADTCASPPASSYPYAFSTADNLTNNNGTTQQYNAADELCWSVSGSSADACGTVPSGATTYNYDDQGNLASDVPASGPGSCNTFDLADQLTKIQTGTGSGCGSASTVGTYAYDGSGLRESKAVSGTTTQYLWDPSNASLLDEKSGSADPTYYVYGPGGLPLEQIDPSGDVHFYSHDQLGSTRALSDASGTSEDTWTYGPYGNVVSSSGSVANNLLYAGQYLDSESGLYYLRARYYNASTGQFLSVDPDLAETMSPYGYAGGDVTNGSDPSGKFGVPSWVSSTFHHVTHAVGSAVKSAWNATGGQVVNYVQTAHLCLRNPLGGNNGNGGCETTLSDTQGAVAAVAAVAVIAGGVGAIAVGGYFLAGASAIDLGEATGLWEATEVATHFAFVVGPFIGVTAAWAYLGWSAIFGSKSSSSALSARCR